MKNKNEASQPSLQLLLQSQRPRSTKRLKSKKAVFPPTCGKTFTRKEINLLTFYEKELHRLFEDSERISADTVFAGKTMITKIGEDLRAKVQFVNTKISGQYDALRLTIINRHEGTVDSETFKFSDIIGMKGDRAPHVWDDGERVGWYIYKPTAYDYNLISDAIEDYISMYADQGYCFDSGMEMGGM